MNTRGQILAERIGTFEPKYGIVERFLSLYFNFTLVGTPLALIDVRFCGDMRKQWAWTFIRWLQLKLRGDGNWQKS
jgi:hypothetical protein